MICPLKETRMMIVNLHLGLPKTATTTLQNDVFPTYAGVSYQGRHGGPEIDQSQLQSLRECWRQFSFGDDCKDSMESWLEALVDLGAEKILISEETLMEWRSPRDRKASRWVTQRKSVVDTPRSGPHPINEFLSMILERLPESSELRAILTLRNQADFLGSLSAQMGKPDPAFVEHALMTKDPFLDFFRNVKDLEETLGRKNLLLLFYEDGVEYNSWKIAEFIGAESQKLSYQETSRLNVKRVGESVWKTAPEEPRIVTVTIRKMSEIRFWRTLKGPLEKVEPWVRKLIPKQTRIVSISPEQRQAIKSHFKNDNDQLSKLSGRNLSEMGY